jgi:hypothetical protein
MAIKAKIANVLTNYDVAFNAGADAGVTEGAIAMTFRETEVTDPDTGELLGVVRRPQFRFRITEVQPKFSIGTTIGSVRKPSQSIFLPTEPSERVRVTTEKEKADYRTWFISLGRDVEIVPPQQDEE